MLLAACRLGFESRRATDAANDTTTSDAPIVDAAIIDNPPGTMTLTFGERPTSLRQSVTTDTTLAQQMSAENNGAGEDMGLEEANNFRTRALLRFELSSVPPGTVVVDARLKLVHVNYNDEMVGQVVVRLVTESWVEGAGDGMVVQPGVTWATRDGTTTWMTPGGTTSTLLATVTPLPPQTEIVLPVAAVQNWIDTPSENNGVQLASAAEPTHYHFYQASGPMPSGCPELTLVVQQ